VQLSALVDDQVRVTVAPMRASAIAAEKVTVGAGGGPPPPPQLTSNPAKETTMIEYHARMTSRYWTSVRYQTVIVFKAGSIRRRH
jgi:hypothetical protein